MLIKEICQDGRVSGENWLQLSRRLEKSAMDRLHQLKRHRKWKSKNKNLIARDKAFKTVINEFKAGRITHEEYVRKIVKLNKQSDIPRGKRAVLRLLDSDSE